MKYALAIHTSSPQLGLGISNFDGDTRYQTWDLDRQLSNYLHEYLNEFIKPQKWQDLAFIAVSQGPGSFTSTRIGVVTARTIAQQLQIPLFGVSSLAAFVWSQRNSYPLHSLIAVQTKATRDQLYVAIYQLCEQGLITCLPDTLMKPENWRVKLDSFPLGISPLEVPVNLGFTVEQIGELAHQDWRQGKQPHWSEILPFYP